MFFQAGDTVTLDSVLDVDINRAGENLPDIVQALCQNILGYRNGNAGPCPHVFRSNDLTFVIKGCAQVEDRTQYLVVCPLGSTELFWCTSCCVTSVGAVLEFNKDSVVVTPESKEIRIVDGQLTPLVTITRTGKYINVRKDKFLDGVIAVAELFGVSGRFYTCGITTADYKLDTLATHLRSGSNLYPRLVVREKVTT